MVASLRTPFASDAAGGMNPFMHENDDEARRIARLRASPVTKARSAVLKAIAAGRYEPDTSQEKAAQ